MSTMLFLFTLIFVNIVATNKIHSQPSAESVDDLDILQMYNIFDPMSSNRFNNIINSNHPLFHDDSPKVLRNGGFLEVYTETADSTSSQKPIRMDIIQIVVFVIFIIMSYQTIMKRVSLRFLYSLMFIYGLQQHSVYSFSACDPTDVFFLVDTASVIANSDGLIRLIESIISSGSSEETGYSVIIWGDEVPNLEYGANANNDNSILCEISETSTTYNRPKQIEIMEDILKDAFDKIKTSDSDRSISFESALNFALQESKSDEREHINRQVHGNNVGLNEDEDVFMVFDYENILGENEELEQYIDQFENNKFQSIHFILGKSSFSLTNVSNETNSDETKVKISDPSESALKTHFFLFKPLIDDIGDDGVHSMWDQFLDLTCPATIIADKKGSTKKGSKLGLGNHIQYTEADTINSCHTEFDEETDEMDENKSFLIVRDDLDEKSTATFNKGDFLAFDPETHEVLPFECGRIGIVKIIKVTIINNDILNNANILKLQIKEPDDLSEYITGGNFEGIIDDDPNDDNTDYERRRMLNTYSNITDYDDDDERRGMLSTRVGFDWSLSIKEVYKKDKTYTKKKKKNGVYWTFTSSGKLTSTYKAKFSIGTSLYLGIDAGLSWCHHRICFCWSPWSGWGCCANIPYPCGFYFNFHVQLKAWYSFDASFKLEFVAKAKLHMPRLLYSYRDKIAFISGVPVKYRPWFQIDLLTKTVPIYAEAWIECKFGHTMYIGYEYKSRGGGRGAYVSGPISRGNRCDKGWNIGAGNPSRPEKIGLDTTFDVIAGLDFYKSVSGQFIIEFKAPLYVEFTPPGCSYWGPCDQDFKAAILTFKIDYQPMYRIVFNTYFVTQAAKAMAASLLSVFGIHVDLSSSTSNKIGHVDKSKCTRIGSGGNIFTMKPKCYDISGYTGLNILIDKYCKGTTGCSSYSYNRWIKPACNGVSAQIGYSDMDDFHDVDDVIDIIDVVPTTKFADNSTVVTILLIGYLVAAILCCINIRNYIKLKQKNAVKYERVEIYSSNEDNNQSV